MVASWRVEDARWSSTRVAVRPAFSEGTRQVTREPVTVALAEPALRNRVPRGAVSVTLAPEIVRLVGLVTSTREG